MLQLKANKKLVQQELAEEWRLQILLSVPAMSEITAEAIVASFESKPDLSDYRQLVSEVRGQMGDLSVKDVRSIQIDYLIDVLESE